MMTYYLKYPTIRVTTSILWIALLAGCNETNSQLALKEVPQQEQQSDNQDSASKVLPVHMNEDGEDQSIAHQSHRTNLQETNDKLDAVEFEPPFPDRTNLFESPKRSSDLANSQPGLRDPIDLLGFVNVDRQRAVLLINGTVISMFEGGEQNGIEVISIQPPMVVLQRGRERWQATLEN